MSANVQAQSLQAPITINLSSGMTITVLSPSNRKLNINVSPSTAVKDLKLALVGAEDLAIQCQRLFRNGERLANDNATLQAAGIQDVDELHLLKALKGDKPVIYLLPPAGSEVDATVKLSLVPEWQISAHYPVVPTTASSSGGQTLEWNVKALRPNGTLVGRNTGLEVSYLFWEAEALKGHDEPLSPLPSPTAENASFNLEPAFISNRPEIHAANSVA